MKTLSIMISSGRYVAWVEANHRLLLFSALVLGLISAFLASTLPLHTEFSRLLPENQPSVVALHKLLARKPASAVIEVGIASPSKEATERFAKDLTRALREGLPKDLVREVDDDDGEVRRFIWQNRYLYASLADLKRARTALEDRLAKEQGKHNPLLVDLDDEPEDKGKTDSFTDLQDRLQAAKAQAERPPGYVAEDGKLRMLVVRCPFGDTEPEKGSRVLFLIESLVAKLQPSAYHPQMEVGFAGDPVTAALEHQLVLKDVVLTALLCLVLVAGLLLVTLRAHRAVIALCVALLCGCALTFGFTRLVIGDLNSSTAFLGSVVAGNGINFGIILLFRYLEERRFVGASHSQALQVATSQTALPTLVAALAAGTAYLSLWITSFRGFSEFGIIAGSGMVFCWGTSFVVLPALLTLLDRRSPLVSGQKESRLKVLTRLKLPARIWQALAVLAIVATTVLSGYGVVRLAQDPFEDDLRQLRSRSLPQSAPGQWSRRLDKAFGRDLSGGFYLGVEKVEHVEEVVAALRQAEAGLPKEKWVFGKIDAISLVLPGSPKEQQAKLQELAELRRLMDKIKPHLESGSKEETTLADLRPPEGLRPLGFVDLPGTLQRFFTEQDGRQGLLLAVHPADAYVSWSYRDIHQAVTRLRSLKLPQEIEKDLQISGPEILFDDMMTAVKKDGPKATLLSLGLVLLLLFFAFGLGRDFLITSGALLLSIFGMLGLMHLCGVRLNFLNFIAVPITIGIGVDYPFNIMARLRQEIHSGQASRGLLQTGGAVVLCSLTTLIGYAVLLLSDTGAIRSFGAAAVLGEITSIVAAVVTVPCLLLLVVKKAPKDTQQESGLIH